MKCKFCASSLIEEFSLLNVEDLMEILEYLYNRFKLYEEERLSVSLTGIGEMKYTIDVIEQFINKANEKYDNLSYVVSSIAINNELINRIEKIAENAKFRFIQLSYISDDCTKLIPNLKEKCLDNIINIIKKSKLRNFRINYIMINDVNDEEDKYADFLEAIKTVADKVIVRISTINKTKSSEINNIYGTSIEKMKRMQEKLIELGVEAYIFKSKENDNMNCGQLISEIQK